MAWVEPKTHKIVKKSKSKIEKFDNLITLRRQKMLKAIN